MTNKKIPLSKFNRKRGHCCRDRMVVVFQLPVQSVSITTKVVSSNIIAGVVYPIRHYVIKFVSDLRQVGGFRSRYCAFLRQ